VKEHAATPSTSGISALPHEGASAFASTQAMWRFLNNERVTLSALIAPARECGRQAVAESRCGYALCVHDWSKLGYPGHRSKTDQTQISSRRDIGYELLASLLVDADRGCPLAPLALELRCADGVQTTQQDELLPPQPHLTRITALLEDSAGWGIGPRLVHVIDRQADSIGHMRTWHAGGHLFLVRANGSRRVQQAGSRQSLRLIAEKLWQEQAFVRTREVTYHGRPAAQFVAEADIVLDGPAMPRTPTGRRSVCGFPLPVRLIVTRVCDEQQRVLAEWLLLTNVPQDVTADQIALWYYWRWQIESFFKLLKSHGQQLEDWQQETAGAIARRLAVAGMACVYVWLLQQARSPQAVKFRQVLVRLSGRQMKRSRPVTAPALLHGLEKLLAVLALLEDYTPEQLRAMLRDTLPLPAWFDTG
jgi:hypothetical protein